MTINYDKHIANSRTGTTTDTYDKHVAKKHAESSEGLR